MGFNLEWNVRNLEHILGSAPGTISNIHLVSSKPFIVCWDLLPWCQEQSKAKKESMCNDRSKGLAGRNHSGRVEKVIVTLLYATLGKMCSLNITSSPVNNKRGWTLKPSPLWLPKTLLILPFAKSVWLSTPLRWNAKVDQKNPVHPETKWQALVSVINRAPLLYPDYQMLPTGGSISAIWCKTNTMKSSIFPRSIFIS